MTVGGYRRLRAVIAVMPHCRCGSRRVTLAVAATTRRYPDMARRARPRACCGPEL